MRIGLVIGKITLNRRIDEFEAATLKVVMPLMLNELESVVNDPNGAAKDISAEETLVAWDHLGTNAGSLVAISEGPEASMPFRPSIKPVDAQVVALLDHVTLKKKN